MTIIHAIIKPTFPLNSWTMAQLTGEAGSSRQGVQGTGHCLIQSDQEDQHEPEASSVGSTGHGQKEATASEQRFRSRHHLWLAV